MAWKNKQEFAQSIKAKYPQYADIPDNELADKMLTKYPQYQKDITAGSSFGGFMGNLGEDIKSTVQGVVEGTPGLAATSAVLTGRNPLKAVGAALNSTVEGAVNYPETIAGKYWGTAKENPSFMPVKAPAEAYKHPVGTGIDLITLLAAMKGLKGAPKAPIEAPVEAPVALSEMAPKGMKAGLVEDLVKANEQPVTPAQTTESLLASKFPELYPKQNMIKRIVGAAKNIVKPNEFASRVRQITHDVKRDVISGWSRARETLIKKNPNKIINASDAFDATIEAMQDAEGVNPTLSKVVNSIPELKNIIENPDLAHDMTLTQSNDLINKIQSKIPKNELVGAEKRTLGYKAKPEWYDVKNLVNDIKAAETDAFPEWKGVRKKYGEVAEAYKTFRPKVKKGTTIKNLAKGMGDKEVRAMVKEYFPPEVADQIKDYHTAIIMLRAAGAIGGAGVAYEAGKGALGK